MPSLCSLPLPEPLRTEALAVSDHILAYLMRCREERPGEYYGSFWSEKAYHGPLLDYHAGGSHHQRTAGSAGLALWLAGQERGEAAMRRAAELAFDWLAARQRPRGGYQEIQNNETPSDWEFTGLEELSTIETAFVVHGLGQALLRGLAPKKSYMDLLQRAGHWQLSIEWPPGSGVFPHHERSPYNTLNANLHAAETLALAYVVLDRVYGRRLNLFLEGARRAVARTVPCQWPDGCLPYREGGGVTINYTSLVLWCLMNILEALPEGGRRVLATAGDLDAVIARACAFLGTCVDGAGGLLWEPHETSTAKYNLWTYLITANVLWRHGDDASRDGACRLLRHAFGLRTPSGLLPMRDRGEEVTECAFMQADMLLFLMPLTRCPSVATAPAQPETAAREKGETPVVPGQAHCQVLKGS